MTSSDQTSALKKKLLSRIAAAQKQADAARKAAKLAKAVFKQAKGKFKDAKRAAKKHRKELKALKVELAALAAKKKTASKPTAKSTAMKRPRPSPAPAAVAETPNVPETFEAVAPVAADNAPAQ